MVGFTNVSSESERSGLEPAYRRLRDWIAHGNLAPNEALEEASLAQRLGCSLSQARAVLERLVSEGLVERHGGASDAQTSDTQTIDRAPSWSVAGVDPGLAGRIYPVLQLLEPLALELALPRLGFAERRTMRHLNSQIEAAIHDRDGKAAALYDAAWHDVFIERCGNPELLRVLRDLKINHVRLAIAYWRVNEFAFESVVEHRGVVEALEQADLATAKALLAVNWSRPLQRFLREQSG
jgi:DNA-binding GntR family transcriptional regulator